MVDRRIEDSRMESYAKIRVKETDKRVGVINTKMPKKVLR